MARVIDVRAFDVRAFDVHITDVRAHRRRQLARAMVLWPCLLAALSTARAGGGEPLAPEPTPGVTLRHLVDVARRNKAAELAAATARLAGAPGTSGDPAVPVPVPARPRGDAPAGGPRLWSLVAVGDRWRAEVLMGGRLHAVDGSSGPEIRIGRWRVLGLASEGLRIEQVASGGRAFRHLVLPPPARGAAAASYRFVAAGSPDAGSSRSAGLGRPAGDDGGEAGDVGDFGDAAVHRAAALPLTTAPAVAEAAPQPQAAAPSRPAVH